MASFDYAAIRTAMGERGFDAITAEILSATFAPSDADIESVCYTQSIIVMDVMIDSSHHAYRLSDLGAKIQHAWPRDPVSTLHTSTRCAHFVARTFAGTGLVTNTRGRARLGRPCRLLALR